MNERYVLDASAILCLIQNEPGSSLISKVLPISTISAVNFAEVVAKMHEHGLESSDIGEVLDPLQLKVIPFDMEQARLSGLLRRTTKMKGLSLGDRACLTLAMQLKSVALTTDRSWSELADVGEVQQAR
jgi:ribonuclease VapC